MHGRLVARLYSRSVCVGEQASFQLFAVTTYRLTVSSMYHRRAKPCKTILPDAAFPAAYGLPAYPKLVCERLLRITVLDAQLRKTFWHVGSQWHGPSLPRIDTVGLSGARLPCFPRADKQLHLERPGAFCAASPQPLVAARAPHRREAPVVAGVPRGAGMYSPPSSL